MGYDGTIQFDVAMDVEQFRQGIEEISFLLENMQIDGLQQRIVEQLNIGEPAMQYGMMSGTQFASGFAQGMSLLANDGNLFGTLFANLPLQAYLQGQLADEQFAMGLMSGQASFAGDFFVAGILNQFMTLPLMTLEIMNETIAGFAGQLVSGAEIITLATMEITNGILLVLEELPPRSAEMAVATGVAMADGLSGSAPIIVSAAFGITQSVANALGELPSLTAGIIPQVLNGMAQQMDQLAPSLYSRAGAIASNISSQLSSAFSVSAPASATGSGGGTRGATPRAMAASIDIGESGMNTKVRSFAEGIQKEFAGNGIGVAFSAQLENSILQNRTNNLSQKPYSMPSTKGVENSVNLGGLTQNFYSPQAPTPAEATQQGIAFLEQARWKLPQMSR